MTNTENDMSNIFFQNITPEPGNNRNNEDSGFVPNNNEMKPKKPKERSMFLPIAAVCLILILAVSAVTFVLLNGKDKKTSLNEQSSLLDGLFDFKTPIDDYIGTTDISKEIMSGKSEISGDLSITDISGYDEYEGLSFDYALKRNAISKETGFDISVKYNNANALSANLYANEDELLFKIPTLASDVFTVDFDKLFNRIKAEWVNDRYLSDSEKMLVDKYFAKENIAMFLGDWEKFSEGDDIISTYLSAIKETYPEDYKKIVDGITTSIAENDEYGNSGTVYTISEDSIELFVSSLLTVSLDNKELYSQLSPVIDSYYKLFIDESTVDITDEDELNEQLRSELKSISSAFAMFFNEDISFTVWKNKNGLLTGLESNTDINIMGELFTVEFEITSENDTNPSENMNIRLSVIYEDESIDLNYNRTTSVGEVLDVIDSFSMDVTGENIFTLTLQEILYTSDNTYAFDLTFELPDEDDVEFILSGTMEELVKGKSFHLVIDEVCLTIGYEKLFTAEGNVTVNTGNVTIAKPDGTQKNLMDMSDEELEDWGEDLFGNIESDDIF